MAIIRRVDKLVGVVLDKVERILRLNEAVVVLGEQRGNKGSAMSIVAVQMHILLCSVQHLNIYTAAVGRPGEVCNIAL